MRGAEADGDRAGDCLRETSAETIHLVTNRNQTTDFFTDKTGTITPSRWRKYWKLLRLCDSLCDARIANVVSHARRSAAHISPQNILIAAVEVPGREADLRRVFAQMTSFRHNVTYSVAPMGERGKFDNINAAIAKHPIANFDWLILTDDDVELPQDFIDLAMLFSVGNSLKISMPAHRFHSYKSFSVTERSWASTVRLTNFVEIGPVTIINRDAFSGLVPFPSLRYAWGLDILWSEIAKMERWRLGVIDAIPIRHIRPVGRSYSANAAQIEAVEFLARKGVHLSRHEIMNKNLKIYGLPRLLQKAHPFSQSLQASNPSSSA
jgi:hypothetical protein